MSSSWKRSLTGYPLCLLVVASTVVFAGSCSGPPASPQTVTTAGYFPPYGTWEAHVPEIEGVDPARLQEAIDHAIASESEIPRDLSEYLRTSNFGSEPYPETLGPTTVRAPLSGLVVRNGYIVANWGQTAKVDMTFSVTKTFLSTTVGLAWDRGLIRNLHDPVFHYMPTQELFATEHNQKINWNHLLRQTSDWRGTLFAKPDWSDRPPAEMALEDLPDQPLNEPGAFYKYNDVRVNLLALVALNVWRRPLPEVLREHVMNPIGASSVWRWHGYENSWVLVDGQSVQSVSGGGHWGGGMHISAYDLARFGYLFLRNGVWDGQRIISEEWIELARTPGPANDRYGFMNWFLNTPHEGEDRQNRLAIPAAPETAVTFRGAGSNIIYIDWENDLVVVVRWIGPGYNEFIAKILAALEQPKGPLNQD